MASSFPRGLPRNLWYHWHHPWTLRARTNPAFRRWLQRNGYLTPNFTRKEAACKDPAHTPVPHSLIRGARNHAFNLERLRHRLGDVALPVNSWYRTPAWNKHEGGAKLSQHMSAKATDFTKQLVDKIGRDKFLREANTVFSKGGLGIYPGGAVHTDSRGWRARWSSWVSSLVARARGATV